MIISVDDNSKIDFIPSKCPICLDVMWRDTISFSCLRCQEKICYNCIINIMETANTCPFCRYKITSIIEEMELDNLLINDDYDDSYSNESENENQDTNVESDEKNCKKYIYQCLMISLFVLLLINAVYLLSFINYVK